MPKRKTTPKPLFAGSPHLKQWQKCYEDWLEASKNHSGSAQTCRSYRSITQQFFTNPHRAPEFYEREDVATFIHSQVRHAGGTLCDPCIGTQNARIKAIRSFYQFASQYDVSFRGGTRPLMSRPDPTRAFKGGKAGQPVRGLTEDELKRLFAAIPRETVKHKRDFALFSFYFWTARRREEIVRLTWGDIYEVVFIEHGAQRVGHMYRFSTKGHSRETFSAELPDPAWDALIDYLKASERWDHMMPTTPLFVTSRYSAGPERALCGDFINHILQQYAELAGLHAGGRKISLHWLRHTRAQLQFKEDTSEKSISKIKKLLMHERMETTMLYLAGAKEDPDDGASRLSKKLGHL